MRLLEIRITLLDVCPPIWRTLFVSPELMLSKLHGIIQAAMGWEDAHLHRFIVGSERYSDPRFELDDGSRDEKKVQVGKLFAGTGDRVSYEYDFGDNWQHELRLEQFRRIGCARALCHLHRRRARLSSGGLRRPARIPRSSARPEEPEASRVRRSPRAGRTPLPNGGVQRGGGKRSPVASFPAKAVASPRHGRTLGVFSFCSPAL